MNKTTTPSAIKRKTIDEFFHHVAVPRPNKIRHMGKDQRSNSTADIPGLELVPDFVTPKEETNLLDFLDAQQWRSDLSRRVIHYGGTYCLLPPQSATEEERKVIERNILTADPIPASLNFIIERMINRGIYRVLDEPKYCIVNEYRENQGISAHVENFKFMSPVCGLTLNQGDWIRFHELAHPDDGSVRSGKAAKAERTGKKLDIWMPNRSLLIIGDDAREKWQHEIVRSRRDRVGNEWRRVSLTFRAERRTARMMSR